MGSDWQEVSLADVATFRNGAGIKQDFFSEHGTPLVRVSDFTSDSIDMSASRFVENGHAQTWASHLLCKDDVIVATVGSWPPNWSSVVGKVVRVPESAVGAIQNQNTCCIIPKANRLDVRFLFYRLKLEDFAWFAANSAGGSANQARLPVQKLGSFSFCLPELKSQKAISRVLNCLDEKIELNRQMNTTLEAMAQALFKSWFVDFDPVIDNALAAGNPIPDELAERAERRKQLHARTAASTSAHLIPGQPLPAAIQQQFPDRFVFSEAMGWVPEGWDERAVGEYFDLLGGHPFKSSEYQSEGLFGVVTIRNVQDGHFVEECTNNIDVFPSKMKLHCRLSKGDVLLSLTGNVGRICMVSEGAYVLNQRVSKVVGVGEINDAFGYFFFRHSALYEMMLVIAKGTAQQNLSSIETAKLKMLLPHHATVSRLSEHFKFYFERILKNTVQNQVLKELRNTLLPKLLSGQLRIPEAEQQIAEVI